MRITPTPLAAALVLAAAAIAPAAAQQLDAAAPDRPIVRHAPPADDTAIRPLVRVRLAPEAGVRLPARVTVADSAGVLLGSFRLRGEGVVRPMMVTIQGSDLVLQADTPEGQLTLRLHGLNDPATRGDISGRWSLGGEDGALSGHARR